MEGQSNHIMSPMILSPSWTRCDKGSLLRHSRESSIVKKEEKKEREKKSKSERRKKKKRRKKPMNPSSKSSDDDYYLRWNASGDFDSDDDDWWNEVTELERLEHEGLDNTKNKKMLARQEEKALYVQYKYHTKRVMEWGNSFWSKGSRVGSDVSLRTILWRLNNLALEGTSMPPNIYRNLELAVALRKEFQIRFVSEPKREERNTKIRKKRRNDWKITDPSALVSPWPRNVGVEQSVGDGEIESIDNESSSKNLINDICKYEGHRWILDQLKLLLKQFENNSGLKKIDSNDKNDERSTSTVFIIKSSEAIERDHRPLANSFSIEKCSSKTIQKRSRNEKRIDESYLLDPYKDDDAASTVLPTCISTSLPAMVSPICDISENGDKLLEVDCSFRNFCPQLGDANIISPMSRRVSNRSDHLKKFDSVWDLLLREGEQVSVFENALEEYTQKDEMFIPNTEPPDDWETLLEEDEEEIELESQVTIASDAVEK